jgi:hypothetical protein
VETVFSDYNEFVKEEEKLIKGESSSMDDYKNFMDKNEERMTGVQPQERVQDERARHQEPREFLQGGGGDEETPREGPNHVYVCATGVVPLDINATRRAMEHLEPELNRLMRR